MIAVIAAVTAVDAVETTHGSLIHGQGRQLAHISSNTNCHRPLGNSQRYHGSPTHGVHLCQGCLDRAPTPSLHKHTLRTVNTTTTPRCRLPLQAHHRSSWTPPSLPLSKRCRYQVRKSGCTRTLEHPPIWHPTRMLIGLVVRIPATLRQGFVCFL